MFSHRYPRPRGVLLAGALGFAALCGQAQADDVLSQAVGKNLQQAQQAMSAHRYGQAMTAVKAADAVKNKTDYETYTIAQMRAAIATQSGDAEAAKSAYATLISSPRTPQSVKGQMLMAQASLAYKAHDYATAIASAQRYLRAFGPDPRMQTMLIQSYYLQQDWNGTAKAARPLVEAAERSGKTPPENQLQMLATAYTNLHDTANQTHIYVKLAKYYPRPDYWKILIHNLTADPTLSPRLAFNVERLRLATGVLKDPSDYQDMGERAVQMGLPRLALNLLDQGYANHVLGTGPNAAGEAKFRAFVAKQAEDAASNLHTAIQEAGSAPNAGPALTAGYNQVLNGQVEPGLALMRTGLGKNPRFPDIALLEYGMAQMDGGLKAAAIRTFNSIQNDGSARDVAQLWSVLLSTR